MRHAFVRSGFGCSLLELFGKHPNRDPNGFEPVRHNAFSYCSREEGRFDRKCVTALGSGRSSFSR
jgi:hypothetical protein